MFHTILYIPVPFGTHQCCNGNVYMIWWNFSFAALTMWKWCWVLFEYQDIFPTVESTEVVLYDTPVSTLVYSVIWNQSPETDFFSHNFP